LTSRTKTKVQKHTGDGVLVAFLQCKLSNVSLVEHFCQQLQGKNIDY
jgi:hypothetical protein